MVLGDITFSTKSNLFGNIDEKHYVLSMEQPHYKKLQLCAGQRHSRDGKSREQNTMQGADVLLMIPLFSDLSK